MVTSPYTVLTSSQFAGGSLVLTLVASLVACLLSVMLVWVGVPCDIVATYVCG